MSRRLAYVVLAALTTLTACGNSKSTLGHPSPVRLSTTTVLAGRGPSGCRAVPKADPAAELPREIPLPPGTFATDVRTPVFNGRRYQQFEAVAPVDLDGLVRFLTEAWPPAGIARGGGERDTGDLETSFYSSDLSGALTANTTLCDSKATLIVLSVSSGGSSFNHRP
jgi:hypothetical protein